MMTRDGCRSLSGRPQGEAPSDSRRPQETPKGPIRGSKHGSDRQGMLYETLKEAPDSNNRKETVYLKSSLASSACRLTVTS